MGRKHVARKGTGAGAKRTKRSGTGNAAAPKVRKPKVPASAIHRATGLGPGRAKAAPKTKRTRKGVTIAASGSTNLGHGYGAPEVHYGPLDDGGEGA